MPCAAIGASVHSPRRTRHGDAPPGDSRGLPIPVPVGAVKSAVRRPGRRAARPDPRTPEIVPGRARGARRGAAGAPGLPAKLSAPRAALPRGPPGRVSTPGFTAPQPRKRTSSPSTTCRQQSLHNTRSCPPPSRATYTSQNGGGLKVCSLFWISSTHPPQKPSPQRESVRPVPSQTPHGTLCAPPRPIFFFPHHPRVKFSH